MEGLEPPDIPTARGTRDRRVTEAELEAAALHLLVRDGVLAGLNLREVASEAGINRGLVYQFYGSRRALLRSAFNRMRRARVRDADPDIRALPLAERRRLLFRQACRSPVFARIEALLALDGDEDLLVFPVLDNALEEVARDVAAGELDPSLDSRAVHALTMAVQLGYCVFREHFARELDIPAAELDARCEHVLGRMLEGLRP